MSASYNYNGKNISTFLAAPAISDSSNTILTNYNVNRSPLQFLKPFYTNTTDETTFDNDYRMYATINGYSNSGFINKFSPTYVLYPGNANTATDFTAGTNATYSGTPPTGATDMLVFLVGGGGGGGGPIISGGSDGYSGGSGGSGGISVYYLPAAPYSLTIGRGGLYGYINGFSASGPGASSDFFAGGSAGGDASGSSMTVSGTTYSVNGGGGGGGGTANTAGAAGADAAIITTSTIYSYAGNPGIAGTLVPKPGSGGQQIGGLPKYNNIINTGLISMVSAQTQITTNNVNPKTFLSFGEGGNSGMAASGASQSAANGEFGAPGCAIVFFYFT